MVGVWSRLFSQGGKASIEVDKPSPEYLLSQIDKGNLPRHIAIIMDGNGRWANERGLIRYAGHKNGMAAVRLIVEQSRDLGIQHLTVFAFSTENWRRPKEETDLLMSLLDEYLDRETMNLHKQGIRLNFIGEWQDLPTALSAKIRECTAFTAENTEMVLNIAFNYGGRHEILNAVRILCAKAASGEISAHELEAAINEEAFSALLDTAGQPDPDLLIRTSGERRLSNFLLWQTAYAEFYFTNVHWPDFGKEQLLAAIIDYQRRSRRFGALDKGSL